MRVYLHLFFILFAMVLASCAPASEEPASGGQAETEAVVETIEDLEAQYAFAIDLGDLEAILAIYSEDGAHMVPNQPAVVGKSAIRTLWEERFEQNDYQTTTQVEGVKVAGDLAVSRMTMSGKVTPKDGSEPNAIDLKGITLYQRQSDGSWKRVWSTYNSNTPPAAPTTS